MSTSFELRISSPQFAIVDAELRAGPRDEREFERAGFLLCGVSTLGDRTLLLARAWMPVPIAARSWQRGLALAWSAEFNAAVLDEADRLHAAPILLHRHASPRDAGFSRRDREHGDRLLSAMSASAQSGVAGSVVLHDTTAAGLLWLRDQPTAALSKLRIVGYPIVDLEPTVRRGGTPRPRLQRQTIAIGPTSDARLAAATVAVVGLSGGGSHVVQQLAHAGLGHLTVIDDDVVDVGNRGRVVGTRHDDDGRLKTDIMERLANEIDPGIEVHKVPYRSGHPAGLAALRAADLIVACVDRFDARAEINGVARRYLVPLIDLGMTIESDGEALKRATGQVVLALPGQPCLRCTPLLSDAVLERERRIAPPGYDRNPSAQGAAQVVSMNGLLASQAVTVALGLITGYLGDAAPATGAWWQYDAREGQLDASPLTTRRLGCPGCAEEAHGDPWFAVNAVGSAPQEISSRT